MVELSRRGVDLTGQTFGRLIVIEPAGKTKQGCYTWLCECACGTSTVVSGISLRSGATKSCGCLNRDVARKNHTKHGQSNTKLYRSWITMKNRCNNPHMDEYGDYGGRGIRVCDDWRDDYKTFYNDVSELPHFGESGYSLDRIDNDGDYEPGNVRWADKHTQANNRRDNVIITYDGETRTLREWSRILQISYNILYGRLNRGWSVEKAFER